MSPSRTDASRRSERTCPAPPTQVLDASGQMVLPGIFDPHTHIGNERSFEEEAETESRAAVLGGVTTIGIFLRRAEDSYLMHMPAFRRAMDERSYVDSVFHPQIFTPGQLAELPRLADEHGIRSFKFYMSGMPGIVASVSDDFLLEGFRKIAALGADAVACVHCETGALVDKARDELRRTTPQGTLADWEKAHPAMAEALAIQTAAYLAHCAGAHLYVVHLSSRDGLEAVRRCRNAGFRFTVETTTPYLGLASDEPNGFLAKTVPPVRPPEHHDALWDGLRNGEISTVGTDNTSRCRATKKPEEGLHGSRPGIPVLGTHLPALLHYGRERGVALDLLVDRATRGPAQVYGIRSAQGYHRRRVGCGSCGRRSRARTRRARARPQGNVRLLAIRGQAAARMADRHRQGRSNRGARRGNRGAAHGALHPAPTAAMLRIVIVGPGSRQCLPIEQHAIARQELIEQIEFANIAGQH